MERKLASIQRVIELFPIPGADRIEGCRVLGWEFVVKKGEFFPGDLGVFFEVDSILPPKEEFTFLEPKKYRVKTQKFKSQISQGLMFPINAITYQDLSSYQEGSDVTELLGIKKFEPRDPASVEDSDDISSNDSSTKKKKWKAGKFPLFIRKTDETRIQAIPSFLRRHKDKKFYFTEKLDGCSATFFVKRKAPGDKYVYRFHELYGYSYLAKKIYPFVKFLFSLIVLFFPKQFGVASRNLTVREMENNKFWKIAKKLDLENKMKDFPYELCIQGELLGPGVQKNKYGLKDFNFFMFNAWNITTQKFLNYKETLAVAQKLGIQMCPILGEFELNHTIPELVEMSKGRSKLNDKTIREGIVCRAIIEGDDEELGRISFKVINPEFSIKFDE